MSKMQCEYLSASGASADDCAIMGRRTVKGRGRGAGSDDWVLVNQPGGDDSTDTESWGPWSMGLYGIWRAPSKRTFVAAGAGVYADVGQDESEPTHYSFDQVSREFPIDFMKGIWGLAEDCVFAWGSRKNMYGETSRVFRFDGKAWKLHSDLDRPVTALHGSSPEHLCAVGDKGLSTWDGSTWTHAKLPRKGKLLDVFVESEEQAYAVGAGGVFLAATGGDWKVAGEGPLQKAPLLAVAVFQGELYVGAGAAGLLRRSADGALKVFKDNVLAVDLEAREQLVITEPNCVTSTADNQSFTAAGEDMLAELTEGQPIGG